MKQSFVAAIGALMLGATFAFAYTGQQLEQGAKVSMHKATRIALAARPGIIADRELEQESGGSGLRYSFDIRHGKTTYEVGVDAVTGRVLENSKEGPHSD
jgi:uncharacterized membrane protein YkoI